MALGMGFGVFIGVVASIALTVLLYIKVVPSKFDGTFDKKPLQFVHDYFNFKKLYLESILKVIFTFASITCVVGGLCVGIIGNIFGLIGNIFDAIKYEYFSSWIIPEFFATLIGGIAVAILGPIVLRLTYEVIMMFILLVKNVIEINNKMSKNEVETTTLDENETVDN